MARTKRLSTRSARALLATTSLLALATAGPARAAGLKVTTDQPAGVTVPAGATYVQILGPLTVTGNVAVPQGVTVAPGTPFGARSNAFFVSNHVTITGVVTNAGVVAAQGTVTPTQNGVYILGATLTGAGIANSGGISATASNIHNVNYYNAAAGIVVNGPGSGNFATLLNTGAISGTASYTSAAPQGIAIAQGAGISLLPLSTGASVVTLTNSGLVSGSANAVTATATAFPQARSQANALDLTLLGGSGKAAVPIGAGGSATINIVTLGTATAIATASAAGIAATNPASGAVANAYGVYVFAGGGATVAGGLKGYGSTLSGAITNPGTIAAAATATAGSGLAFADGIVLKAGGGRPKVNATSAYGGTFVVNAVNSGLITVTAANTTTTVAPNAQAYGFFATAAGGNAASAQTSLKATGGSFAGTLTNVGTILANVSAAGNNPSAIAVGLGVFAGEGQSTGKGNQATGGTMVVTVVNRGMIAASGTNSGTNSQTAAQSRVVGIEADAIRGSVDGTATQASGGTLLGVILNAGMVTVSAGGFYPSARALEILAGGGQVLSNATAASHAGGGLFTGNVTNGGTLIAMAGGTSDGKARVAQGAVGVFLDAGSPQVLGAGSATAGTIAGSFTNTGLVIASATSAGLAAKGILVGDNFAQGVMSGGIVNTGTVLAIGAALAQGISDQAATLGGGISNTGIISASGGKTAEAVASRYGGFVGGITNSGTMLASARFATGVIISATTFGGGVASSGIIAAQASYSGGGTQGNASAVALAIADAISSRAATAPSLITNTGIVAATVSATLTVPGNAFTPMATATGYGILARIDGGFANAGNPNAAGAVGTVGIVNMGTIAVTGQSAALANAQSHGSSSIYGIKVRVDNGSTSAVNVKAFGGSLAGSVTNLGAIRLAVSSNGSNPDANADGIFAQARGGSPTKANSAAYGGTFSGTLVNTGLIALSASATGTTARAGAGAAGMRGQANGGQPTGPGGSNVTATGGTFSGALLNSGTILISTSTNGDNPVATGAGMIVNAAGGSSPLKSGVSTGGTLNATLFNLGAILVSTTNSGTNSLTGAFSEAQGIVMGAEGGQIAAANAQVTGGTALGVAINAGLVSVSASGFYPTARALEIYAGHVNATNPVTAAQSVTGGTLTASVTNAGTLIANASGTFTSAFGGGNFAEGAVGIVIEPQGQSITGAGHTTLGTIAGNVVNSGLVQTSATGLGLQAIGIAVGNVTAVRGVMSGAIINTGAIVANGSGGAIGVGIELDTPVQGGITNTGTIIGSGQAILSREIAGFGTVITQAGGAITGGVSFNDTDTLNITGGTVTGFVTSFPGGASLSLTGGSLVLRATVVTPAQTFTDMVAGLGSMTQGPGGTLVAQVTPSTAANKFPTISAGTITLGGPIQIAEQPGVFANTTTYVNFIDATTTLSDHHTSLSSTSALLVPSLVATSATTENLVLTRIPFNAVTGSTPNQQAAGSGLEGLLGVPAAAPFIGSLFALTSQQQVLQALTDLSAQNLTQALRTSIETPHDLVDGIETRLITGTTSIAGETRFAELKGADQLSDAAAPQGGTGLGISAWAKGYGVFAQAPQTIGGSRYHENRHGLLLGGDLAFTENLTLGAAFNYVETTQHFADGAGSNEATSYLFSGYGGWHDGPWYANWVGGIGINNYNFSRSIGFLNATATGASSGYSYLGYAEGGYRLGFGQATVTPYAGFGVTHAQFNAFTETGAGAADLAVNSSDTTSLASTIGARASMRLPLGSSTVIPEVRAAWQHEFRDAAQQVSAAFAISPGSSPFTVTGSNFGRDSALLGVGVADEVSPMLKLYVDYDGKFTGSYRAHAITAGLKVTF